MLLHRMRWTQEPPCFQEDAANKAICAFLRLQSLQQPLVETAMQQKCASDVVVGCSGVISAAYPCLTASGWGLTKPHLLTPRERRHRTRHSATRKLHMHDLVSLLIR
jgi:hypothetical protein